MKLHVLWTWSGKIQPRVCVGLNKHGTLNHVYFHSCKLGTRPDCTCFSLHARRYSPKLKFHSDRFRGMRGFTSMMSVRALKDVMQCFYFYFIFIVYFFLDIARSPCELRHVKVQGRIKINQKTVWNKTTMCCQTQDASHPAIRIIFIQSSSSGDFVV